MFSFYWLYYNNMVGGGNFFTEMSRKKISSNSCVLWYDTTPPWKGVRHCMKAISFQIEILLNLAITIYYFSVFGIRWCWGRSSDTKPRKSSKKQKRSENWCHVTGLLQSSKSLSSGLYRWVLNVYGIQELIAVSS